MNKILNIVINKGNQINRQEAKLAIKEFSRFGLKIKTMGKNTQDEIIIRLQDKKTKSYMWVQNGKKLKNLIGKGETKITAILNLLDNIKGKSIRENLFYSPVFIVGDKSVKLTKIG